MIEFTLVTARAVRAVARRCAPGRPRGPAPPVGLRQQNGLLTFTVPLGEVTLTWIGPGGQDDDAVAVPFALLDATDGHGTDPVRVDVAGGRPCARCLDRGVPRVYP